MPDIVIYNAHTPFHTTPVDIVVRDGKISEVLPGHTAAAATNAAAATTTPGVTTVDAAGRLVTPLFVDAHFHLDSVLTRIPNESGTLAEGIRNWAKYKTSKLSVDDVRGRASEYLDRAIGMGIGAIRSHVDVCDAELRAVHALLEVREEYRSRIVVELVAFPQEGLFGDEGTLDRLEKALDMGVDVVGGIPHFERSAQLGSQSITTLLELAADRHLPVDIHCDESDDPLSRHVEHLAAETIRLGLQNRVTASHLTSIATMDPYYVDRKLIPLIAEARLNVIANPLVNVHLGGRYTHPSHRGMTPIRQHLAAGITVALGQDCNEDPWYPLGNADMLEVARMGAHLGHMMGRNDLETVFAMVTTNGAKILSLAGYGLEPGDSADLAVLDAPSVFEAIRTSPKRLAVIRDGAVVRQAAEFSQ